MISISPGTTAWFTLSGFIANKTLVYYRALLIICKLKRYSQSDKKDNFLSINVNY